MERGEWGTSAQHVRQVEQSGRARGKVALRLRAVLTRGALVDRAADGDWWLAARLASSDRDAWLAAGREASGVRRVARRRLLLASTRGGRMGP